MPRETTATTPVAAKPYMGWSSLEHAVVEVPGPQPDGDYSYLTEANVLKQTDALAARLKNYGYDHVNIYAGLWMDKTWRRASTSTVVRRPTRSASPTA